MTEALEAGEWSAARSGRTLLPGKTRYPFYRRLGGPQGRSGRAENLVPTGIRSRTVQPVAQSLYRLSYRVHINVWYWLINCKIFILLLTCMCLHPNICSKQYSHILLGSQIKYRGPDKSLDRPGRKKDRKHVRDGS